MTAAVTRGRTRSGYTMRAASAVAAFWVGAAILVVVVGTPLVRGDLGVFAFIVGPAALLAWLLWMLLYRPLVRYDDLGVRIVNIGRVHELPWSAVSVVQQRIGLDFRLSDGRTIRAIAVPPPARPGNVVSMLDRRERREYDFHHHASVLEAYRIAAPPSAETATSRWDSPALVLGAVLVAVLVVEFAVLR